MRPSLVGVGGVCELIKNLELKLTSIEGKPKYDNNYSFKRRVTGDTCDEGYPEKTN